MVTQRTRTQLITEFAQSHRLTGQLFFQLMQAVVQKKASCNFACLPILKVLGQQGKLSQSAIARELHHSDAAVSRQIGILVDDGLVSTESDTHNRRAILVELTKEGSAMLAELETIMTDLLTETLSTMSDKQLQQIITTNNQLQMIITNALAKESRA